MCGSQVSMRPQGESIYDNFEDGDHQRTKKNIGAQLIADGQLFQILFLEKQLRQNYGDLFFFEKLE